MRAFNVVRVRVKPGFEEPFVAHHRNLAHGFKGFLGGSLVSTGGRGYCFIGEWQSYDDIVAARPELLASLNSVRDMLEGLGGPDGVTDPVSGEVVATLAPTVAPRTARRTARVVKRTKKKVARKVARKVRKAGRKVRRAGRKVARKARKTGRAVRKAARRS